MNNRISELPVEAFIQAQETIRVALDEAGGYGDLAASLHVMADLRHKGFKGIFEAIYPGAVSDKVATLFDLSRNIINDNKDYYDKTSNIRFIELNKLVSLHEAHSLPQVALSVTGAMFSSSPYWSPLVEKLGNMTTLLNAKVFVAVSPWPVENPWPWPPGLSVSMNYIPTYNSDLAQAKKYLNTNPDGQALAFQKPALKTFIESMESKKINIMPAYGWLLQKEITQKYYKNPAANIGNILQVVLGARFAQLNGSEALQNKPLVIPVFYDFKVELIQLSEILYRDNWGQYETPGAEQARQKMKQLGLNKSDVFLTASLSDSNVDTLLNGLQSNQILLLAMGSLPKIVFDGLYLHTGENMLLPVREGANSFWELLSTGKPHVRCGSRTDTPKNWEIGFDLVSDPSLKIILENFYESSSNVTGYNGFCQGMSTWQENSNLYKTLGNLIIEAHKPTTSFFQYFQLLKDESSKPENDRVLINIKKEIEATPLKPVRTEKIEILQHTIRNLKSVGADTTATIGYIQTTQLQASENTNNIVYKTLIAKPAAKLANIFDGYFKNFCSSLRECKTYFPENNPNLWNGQNQHTLFSNSRNTMSPNSVSASIVPALTHLRIE